MLQEREGRRARQWASKRERDEEDGQRTSTERESTNAITGGTRGNGSPRDERVRTCERVCGRESPVRFHGSPEAVAAMASEPSSQSRVVFQAADKTEEPAHRKLGKLTVKYNRKDLQRRLDIEEWIDGQLHLLFDCEVRMWLAEAAGGNGGTRAARTGARGGLRGAGAGGGQVFGCQSLASRVMFSTRSQYQLWLLHQGDKISFSRMRSAERNFKS